MQVIVCPGVHDAQLTEGFLQGISTTEPGDRPWLILPPTELPYSGWHVLQFLQTHLGTAQNCPPLFFLSFSAGVVGAIAAAWGWQAMGGQVAAFVAIDGWGMPLAGNFPIHRLSHDDFTHWSSACLGGGNEDSFYADPAVEHLELWRSPQTAKGWHISSTNPQPILTTAREFIVILLARYGTRKV